MHADFDGTSTAGSRPLTGILVADFSRVLAGPLATMTLADLGARVIKVERPVTGDDTRSWGPPFSSTSSTTYFDSVNRNKESISLNLDDEADRVLAAELVTRADVLVENFKPGGMEKIGLGYDDVRQGNPGIVYASISGFGAFGGIDLVGYDFIVQAVGGLMSITGEEAGQPTKVGVALVDVITGKDAVIGILAALAARERTGTGAKLDLNLLSSLQGALVNQAQAFLGAGQLPGRMGNAHPSIAPYEILNCADGPLAVACGNDIQFRRLLGVLGLESLASDERFATNSARVRHRADLATRLEQRLTAASASVWQQALTTVGVPAGQVASIEQSINLADSLGLRPTIDVCDTSGTVTGRQIRHPIDWTPQLAARAESPPSLDEHGKGIRAWLIAPQVER